jgi:hypothetical protein
MDMVRSRVERLVRSWNASERKAKLGQLGGYMYSLLERFREDEGIVKSEAYALLKRLFEEQCDVIAPTRRESTDEGEDDGETRRMPLRLSLK